MEIAVCNILMSAALRHLKDLEVVPDPFWHLKDLEHGPPPEGGNVILDDLFK